MADIKNRGLIVPTTNVWDVSRLFEINVNSDEFKELLVRLYQNINTIVLAVNQKDTGVYSTQIMANSQEFFPNPATLASSTVQVPYRGVYRIGINCGTLPNNSTISIPHTIPINPSLPTTYTFTRIYGTANNLASQNSFLPLPYVDSTPSNNISLKVNDTDVIITTTADYSAYTVTYVILEYIAN